ncbi:GrlR family regulatory protein [Bradyrhizobium sp.]|uniref:GrlR family regulatory protein n=1 Tax=Bradyrhizobium sp. TaxID=376 RepID=UPI002DDD3971|nr:GrlR family regulatory protein [Bradyrhizobium sp.]HEV2154429.1 GrlR family regulatory protein [Bradyrhizobium sp.]
MLRDGTYAAWFRTPRGQGTGVVDLTDGRISGSDSFFTYGGSYRVDERHFSAVLTVNRYADGPPSVFGLDQVEVKLSGVCNGLVATCSGTAKEAPDVNFEATLIYSQEDARVADAKCAVVKLNADKLPKGLDGRSRPRHPFTPPKAPLS